MCVFHPYIQIIIYIIHRVLTKEMNFFFFFFFFFFLRKEGLDAKHTYREGKNLSKKEKKRRGRLLVLIK
jgi:hypothetical protein